MTRRLDIRARWELVRPYLDHRQRSLWAAAEAEVFGAGGIALLSDVTRMPCKTISARLPEVRLSKMALPGSLANIRERGRGGRKFVEAKDPQIVPALEQMLSEEIAGDPMTQQKWARTSLRRLSKRLQEQGHPVCYKTVGRLMRNMGYSLRLNKRKQVGAKHPDRDKQFSYITSLKALFLGETLPVVSVDTKKKELIGNYRREGKIWCKEPIETDAYFASYAQTVALPFGVYDLAKNAGYVTVGVSHNTSEFAVNCVADWWDQYGRPAYERATRLLVLADGGGGNGYNLRTGKKDLQEKLCDRFGLEVTVSHYPTGCSRWNPIEYRLFSQISMNWAGRPLRTLEIMLGFIRGTTTTTGLRVEACLDNRIYRKGRKATEKEMRQLALRPHEICPRWNYTLSPRPSR